MRTSCAISIEPVRCSAGVVSTFRYMSSLVKLLRKPYPSSTSLLSSDQPSGSSALKWSPLKLTKVLGASSPVMSSTVVESGSSPAEASGSESGEPESGEPESGDPESGASASGARSGEGSELSTGGAITVSLRGASIRRVTPNQARPPIRAIAITDASTLDSASRRSPSWATGTGRL